MLPQETALGSPMFMKDRADSMRMALATSTEVVTITGGSALGRISSRAMRKWLKPMLRAACTNSASRRERNSARTSRATTGQEATPMDRAITATEGRPMATMTTTSRNEGMVCSSSVARMSTASTQPPA